MKEPDWTYFLKAQEHIAQRALTNSKRPECFVKGVYQTHLKSARGPYVWDVENRQLFDFICGMGSMIIGHGNQLIAEAIYRQASQGITLSLSSTIELELAEKVKEIIPWVQKMRFLKTGTEACMAAVKIARAKTGRFDVVSEGYHGWSDEFVALTPPALGCRPTTFGKPLKSFDDINGETAAVIVEPIMTDTSQARVQWLRDLREKCTKTGTILIFDEIITGFRTPKFTMSEYFGIEPDIICLGKAMGGGMPISCVAGKTDVMNCGEYFVSSTFAGETCSIAASLMLIAQLRTEKFSLKDLWFAGEHFKSKFNQLAPGLVQIQGYPSRGVFVGDPLAKALLWQEAYKAGILFGASFFLSFVHIPYLDRILNVLSDILTRIKTGSVRLEGEMPQSPFAQRVREQSN